MDESKCNALKAELAEQEEPQIVPIERFFDGNDDAAAIGCNLMEHPGMNVFRDVLTGLLRRSDVQAIYAQIAELDPGEDSWPFTDTIVVVGTITPDDLREAVSPLQPTDVGSDRDFNELARKHGGRALVVWWD
jgi:hypothetical protein